MRLCSDEAEQIRKVVDYSTKNLPHRLAQLAAVRKSWLDSLPTKLAGAMIHGSPHLAIAPQRFPGGGLVFSACLVVTCGFARVDSVRGSGAATPGKCRRCSVQDWQPGGDLLPLPFKGVFVGAPPAQHAFSPLLLSVQGVEPCFRIGDVLRDLKRSGSTSFHGKDADGGRRDG